MLPCLLVFLTSFLMINATNLKPDYFDELKFETYAKKQQVVTDKVTYHKYQQMYGLFLIPLLQQTRHFNTTIKFLEIGLGCDQNYGPGNIM